MTYRTATAEQKAAYHGVYKLHGFLTLSSGHVCAVEDLREWSRENPQWEVRAPAGYHFAGYTTHGRLLYTLAEVRAERHATLVKCVPGGPCGCTPARRAHVIKRDTSSAVWAPLYLRSGVWRAELAEASVILDGELAEIAAHYAAGNREGFELAQYLALGEPEVVAVELDADGRPAREVR